jgi:hypothetical protein
VKAQCDRCKEIVPLSFSVEAAGIRVRCPACQAEYAVAATEGPPAAAATAPAPAAPPEMTCPKCGEAQRKAAACRRCGLIIARWSGTSVAVGPAPGEAREAAALWTQVEASWDEGPRHEAFIEHCRRAGVLAFAAARYRQAAARPGAAERLVQIRTVAEQSLAAVPRQTERPAAHGRVRTAVLAGVVVVLVVLIWLLLTSAFNLRR